MRERLAKKANVSELSPGDTVLLKAEERLTLTSRHDPNWEVFRVRGPVCWIRNQKSGKTKTVNREKLTLVDPNIEWDEIRVRPIRNSHRTSVPTFAMPRPHYHDDNRNIHERQITGENLTPVDGNKDEITDPDTPCGPILSDLTLPATTLSKQRLPTRIQPPRNSKRRCLHGGSPPTTRRRIELEIPMDIDPQDTPATDQSVIEDNRMDTSD